MSDDGSAAIVVIALLGNPFSPHYAQARRRGPTPALDYCSMNVAVYARGASAWALQERRIAEGARVANGVTIGGSSMRWEADRLVVDVDERTSPFARPLRGRIVLHPEAHSGLELAIDANRDHSWWPVAPLARIEVDLSSPGLRFSGHGYHDANAGTTALEETFEAWSWSRACAKRDAFLTYDVASRSGVDTSLALRVSRNGDVDNLEEVWSAPIARTAWGIRRHARVDRGHQGRIVRSLEDGPFYARALVSSRLGGDDVIAMHETLAANRLRSRLVMTLASCRMRTVV